MARRLYMLNWGATANPVVFVPNERKNIRTLALAGNDTSGSVVVTPQTANDLSGQPVTVSARSPLIAELDGPFTVSMVNGVIATTGVLTNNVLDLFMYDCVPSLEPKRADYRKTFQQLGAASTTPNDVYVPTFNRQSISVTAAPTLGGGTTVDLTISGINFSSASVSNPNIRILFQKTSAGSICYQLDPSNTPVSAVTGECVPVHYDMLILSATFSGTNASNVVDWEVLASDY